MALPDVLLHLDAYPEPTPRPLIEAAVMMVKGLGGKVSALAVQVQFPVKTNRVADYLVGLSQLAQDEEARSHEAAARALENFKAAAEAAGVFGGVALTKASLYERADPAVASARTHDLCLVPLGADPDAQRDVAQALVFESGRPVLLFGAQSRVPSGPPDLAVVAWDGGRCAARAMADALPILAAAKAVRVLTVTNDKPGAEASLGAEAVRHLATHGVAATVATVDRAGRPIGEALDAYLAEAGADLLVMGAFGHSRLREFVLGGATAHVLNMPSVAVVLAH